MRGSGMARRLLAAATALLAVAAVWAWTRDQLGRASAPALSAAQRDGEAPVAPRPGDVDRRADIVAALRDGAVPDPRAWPAPGSLRDTDVDGALAVDADGRLLITPALRRFFEYFFVASGEESDARIRARIETELRAQLRGDAQQAAFDLLERYLAYRQRGRALAEAAAPDADLSARAEALRGLRRESFGEREAAALFADEEAAYADAIEQRRIASDPSLSDAERAAQLAALEARLPQEMREVRAAVTAPLRLARAEAALRDAGGSPEEVQALRAQAVGREAADRLAALDHRRGEWQGRVDAYRQERAAIDADVSASPAERERALDALRARHFSGSELLRIRAIDRMAEQAARER
jgi:lipase chaperone LimK